MRGRWTLTNDGRSANRLAPLNKKHQQHGGSKQTPDTCAFGRGKASQPENAAALGTALSRGRLMSQRGAAPQLDVACMGGAQAVRSVKASCA